MKTSHLWRNVDNLLPQKTRNQMNSTLHILNGDGTAYPFRKTSLKGDHIVWREMLCEGPVPERPDLGQLKTIRFPFLAGLDGSDTAKVESMFYIPFERLRKLRPYENIVLWFEFDLFCHLEFLL